MKIDNATLLELSPTDLVFPLPTPALNDYRGNDRKAPLEVQQTWFGHPRDGGARLHAAVDLVAPAGTAVLAMADGIVLRKSRDFYEGTGAIEVMHPRLGIVRYGEIDRDKLGVVLIHQQVKRGQTIGFVGRRTGATRYMLHLELYTNWHATNTAPTKPSQPNQLTHSEQGYGTFQRRGDLRNPTATLSGGSILRPFEHKEITRSPFSNGLEWCLLQHYLNNVCVRLACPATN